jgi:hypothetical protein
MLGRIALAVVFPGCAGTRGGSAAGDRAAAPAGAYRLVVRTCDGVTRIESEPFEVQGRSP